MALMSRLTRLFRADLHAVLDRLEEPGPLLRQALREMEEALAGNLQALKASEQEAGQLERRNTALQSRIHSTASELDLCFQAGNQGLVRTLLRRRLEAEQLLAHGSERARVLRAETEALRARIGEQQQQLAELRAQALLVDEELQVDSATPVESFGVSEADIDLALLREQQRRESTCRTGATPAEDHAQAKDSASPVAGAQP